MARLTEMGERLSVGSLAVLGDVLWLPIVFFFLRGSD